MRILPQKSFTLKTELTTREVHDVLMSKTEPKKKTDFFFGSSTDKPFCGEVGLSDFKIMRSVQQYKGVSTSPVVIGTVNSVGNGSAICVVMRMQKCIWSYIFAELLFLAVIGLALVKSEFSTAMVYCFLVIALMLFMFILSIFIGFRSGAKRAEEEIRSVFNC